MWLCGAIALSFSLHFVILYVPLFSVCILAISYSLTKLFYTIQTIFSVCALNCEEWIAVFKLSFPVILLDETMKFISRMRESTIKCRSAELTYLIVAWVGFLAVVLYLHPFITLYDSVSDPAYFSQL